VLVTIPPLYRIDLKENGNVTRQLAVPNWQGESAIDVYRQHRIRGFTVSPADGSPAVLVIANSAQPTADHSHAIRLRHVEVDLNSAAGVDFSQGKWLKHPEIHQPFNSLAEYEDNTRRVIESWSDAFSYKQEDSPRNVHGLRPPQLGAIYGVQSHWTVNRDPATVVIPTGVGKTETMISLLVAERCQRLMVVVPTDALRTQLSDKFLTLGLLKGPSFNVIADPALYPVVGVLNRRPADVHQVDAFFRKCNVIVTTMALASQCPPEIIRRMAEICGALFIDEAHHVAAPKWREFREAFETTRIVQFTATPFRNDDKPVGGKRAFTFSLRHAQEQGYFKEIRFKPVLEFDPARKDAAIAEAAVEQLRADLSLGHILMARVGNIARAAEVFECYRNYTEFNPVQLHSGIKSIADRNEIRRQLLSGTARIVVCVDMLGEGFDLPELKIAAFHDIRKTLSVTLQLAGRFTRSKPHLGHATFVANVADLDVKDELRKLYQHDSDWNALLPILSERATGGEFNLLEFLGGFQELPDELTLRNVRPAMSTVVYRTKCDAWSPGRFEEGIAGYESLDKVYHTLNPQEHTLVVVTTRRVPVDWAQIDEIFTWDWQLYVLHWDQSQGLLFIHNSSNAGFFKRLAEAVAGEVEQIRGPNIFRCMAGINRLRLQNVGLLEELGRLIRYTMRAGSDVEPLLTPAQKQRARKANIFGQGFEDGLRTTIGCSYKGRIWSYKTTNLLALTNWCRRVGEKLLNETLDPEEVLNGTLVPEFRSDRPNKFPIAIEWPDIFYTEPERAFAFQMNGQTVYQHEADIILIDPSENGPIDFAISSDTSSVKLRYRLFDNSGTPDYSIELVEGSDAAIIFRSRTQSLKEFFDQEPPTFWFADGSSLCGIEYVQRRTRPDPFPRERIEDWNWSGTKIRVESQGIDKNAEAIQYRIIEELKKRPFAVLFDDDDQGESADVVAIEEGDDSINVEFWHCKFSMDDKPGYRIKDLYEVCGQAQKSIRWMEKTRDLFTHLLRREPRRHLGRTGTRYVVGDQNALLRIREKSESIKVNLRIFVVQPGLSKSAASSEQLELLAVTENYLLETFAVPFGVIASA
jgi:superfamily II DNA or RNA helicase